MAHPASNEQPAENAVFLGKILSCFDGPLNEEQAWAVCYQSAHFLKMSWHGYDKSGGLSLVDGADAICVHKDGSVTVSVREVQSVRGKGDENSADLTGDLHIYHKESEVVNALGCIIYHALDYGCHEEEERFLSEPLEDMIDQMTNSGEGTGLSTVGDEDGKSQGSANTDEGIVDGHESDEVDEGDTTSYRRLSTFADVLKVCSEHLLEPEGAPMHYQAVCRALLAEAIDLTSFLQVIASSKKSLQSLHSDHGDGEDSHLEDIQPKQWARIWMQVLEQLRQGVKLKEINDTSLNQSRIPIEYELTPYEILMDDIRSRRYNLRQVLVNGDLPPRVKKEAHDVILDFIRSRPPLKPVPKDCSQPQRAQTLYERLLSDIRSKPSLAPAANRVLPERKPKLKKKKSRTRPKIRHQSTSEGSCASSVDSEDLDIFDSPEFPRKVLRAGITLDWSDEDDAIETDATLTVTPRTEDDITPQPTYRRDQLQPLRRLETLNAPSFESLLSPDSSVTPTNEEDEARLHEVVDEDGEHDNKQLPMGESPRRHSITVCQTHTNYSSHPERYVPPECLALTVDEVIHIRSVLVKAEIENLRVNPKIHTAVLKEKICFSCKKKFALFKRKTRCKLCKRLICTICTKQMFLPRGHFLQIPIECLSPVSPKRSPLYRGHQPSLMYKSHSEPPTPSISPQGSPRLWRREKQTNRPKEQLDKVCCECKDFLKEAVRASREASYINGTGHRGSDGFRLNSPPELPKQSSRDSEHSDRSTRSTASNRSKQSDGDLHRRRSRQSDIECDAPST